MKRPDACYIRQLQASKPQHPVCSSASWTLTTGRSQKGWQLPCSSRQYKQHPERPRLARPGPPGGQVPEAAPGWAAGWRVALSPPTERVQARPVARHVRCGGGRCFPQSPGQDPGRIFRRYCLAHRLGRGRRGGLQGCRTFREGNLPVAGAHFHPDPFLGCTQRRGTVVGVVPPSWL